MKNKSFSTIRREYGRHILSQKNVNPDPFAQFQQWLDEAVASNTIDPTAMALATVDEQGMPDARVVLLKEIMNEQFIFFTHYQSAKGHQLAVNPVAALNFYWPLLCRQIRVRGAVSQVAEEYSDKYFASRPHDSQVSAIISPQSHVIEGRELLEHQIREFNEAHSESILPRPKEWGGYAVSPVEFEFWQGRDSRLHDRLKYCLQEGKWVIEVLAP